MIEIIRSTYFILGVSLIACFYLIWRRGKNKDQSELFKDFDKLALFIFIFFLITRLFNFIAFSGAYLGNGWSLLPITRVEDFETGNQFYLLFNNFPWIILRFWDLGYFLFASILSPWIYSLIMSKFKFGKVFEAEFLLTNKISMVLVFAFLAYRLLNNNFNDINLLNVISILVMLLIGLFMAFSKKESGKLTFRLSLIFMLALLALEINLIPSVDIYIALAFFLIWLVWGFLLLLKYTAELQITRKDRAKSDIDLVKERAQIFRRYGTRESNSYSLSYKTANKMDTSSSLFLKMIGEKANGIFNRGKQNDKPN